PPEAGDVIRVLEDDFLDLVHQLLALGRVERARLAGEEIVDARIAEAAPVVAVPCRVALEEQVGIVRIVEHAIADDLEAAGVSTVGEPGGGLERPVLGLDTDLAPLLDHEGAEVDVGHSYVPILED